MKTALIALRQLHKFETQNTAKLTIISQTFLKQKDANPKHNKEPMNGDKLGWRAASKIINSFDNASRFTIVQLRFLQLYIYRYANSDGTWMDVFGNSKERTQLSVKVPENFL